MDMKNEIERSAYHATNFDINVDSLNYEWIVAGRSLNEGEVTSQSIYGKIRDVHWQLKLTAQEIPIKRKAEVKLNLILSCNSDVEVNANYHFLINNIRTDDNNFQCTLHNGEASESIFPIDEMYPMDKGEILLTNSAVIVLKLSQELSYAKYNVAPTVLESSLAEMMDSGRFNDLLIETEDGMTIKVHQAILCARSPVFCAMLGNDMMETNTKRIRIPDFSSETVKDMVKYMYTGHVPKFHCDSAAALLKAADKYDLPELKSICSDNLVLNLWAKNAVQLLLLADTHGSIQLKEKALQFIADNKSSFVETSCFKLVENHQSILLDIISVLAKSENQKQDCSGRHSVPSTKSSFAFGSSALFGDGSSPTPVIFGQAPAGLSHSGCSDVSKTSTRAYQRKIFRAVRSGIRKSD